MKNQSIKHRVGIIYIVLVLVGLYFPMVKVYSQDLPSPAANLELLPTGSYIIPMDNSLQANTAGRFNLRSYGLIVHLLNNSVSVKWAIRAAKLKDGIDFSVNTNLVQPASVTGDILRDFKAGPFVISAADTTGVAALVTGFYSSNSLTGNDRPNLYVTSSDVTVDIRYDLAGYVPRAAILNDGSNAIIHLGFMTASSMPAGNYAVSNGTSLASGCFTFASEPHNTNTGPAVDATITAIRDFVTSGGNFLAQCEAVTNYENNALGRFQTTTGVTVANAGVTTVLTYPNADLSLSQFEGLYNGSAGGTVRNWTMPGAGINNEHHHAFRTAGSTYIAASASKLVAGIGGLVFYIGNHTFAATTPEGTNGMRMYLNAMLTPAVLPCPAMLDDRRVVLKGSANYNFINLNWTARDNRAIDYFELEQSDDGNFFTRIASVPATQKRGSEKYLYNIPNTNQHKKYYRIRTRYRNSNYQYGNVISLSSQLNSINNRFTVLRNPVTTTIAIILESKREGKSEFNLYDLAGTKVHSQTIKYQKGVNQVTCNPPSGLRPGTYTLRIADETQVAVFKIVKL
ncbi:MAG: T9SS type A sorting domain-containing protein [Chitinophagaceae bacterium]|nr:T9SS type A sorting domain-containing protein [Chitinophagaceae bacterium]